MGAAGTEELALWMTREYVRSIPGCFAESSLYAIFSGGKKRESNSERDLSNLLSEMSIV